ncbi:tetratricopeptide repeat protein [Flavisolibacter ginsenosidimutans]|uniref:Tetratricopeptide repeat protein n=1 Tax=Flavisolibacter ginsenosidimutans TaxID=661481 RepID=A0A5B8UIP6_9BACT|nr:tetratricopeptide repeat protein [Flavisolibacter ginsenosidimutans]QEC56547.1 tetratricopeptide repeat protein [Flavisolibacter ginsenosidimutans]
MKKSAVVFLFAALFSISAMAQSVQEGVSNWYAERYQSARSIFEKLIAANPNNLEAVYWLGQTLLGQGDVAGAKALYQKTLSTNGNAPWILAGMGQIDLMEGRAAEARAKFDAALAGSKGKKGNDPSILTAVARANVQPYSDDKKVGDLDYAIAKLNEAAQLAPNNADLFVVLGNAYRKKHQGGDAVQAYRKAGTFAPALYRTASIYQSQQNWDAVLEYLNSTIAADPKFAPAYETLYAYSITEKRDPEAADKWGKLYVSNSDPSADNDYILASTAYVRKDFQGAINIANKILQATNNNPKARVYRLLAYAYQDLKDTAKACDYSNRFLTRAAATNDELLANDYLLHATTCGIGNPVIVQQDIAKALQIDTARSQQVSLLNKFITSARAAGQRDLEANLMLTSAHLRGQATPAELFYIGTLFYYTKNFQTSDSVLTAYITAAPDSLQGYYWRGLTRLGIDTASTQGLAVPDFEKTVQLAEADKVRFKPQGTQASQLLTIYQANVKHDKAAALAAVAKGLEFDPTNETLLGIQRQLSGGKTTPPPAKTETKTKTSADSTKTKTKTKGK